MEKCIFIWQQTDGFTYSYDITIPIECEDLDKLILNSVDKVLKSEYGCELFGVYISKDEYENLYHSFHKLDDWFHKNKIEP